MQVIKRCDKSAPLPEGCAFSALSKHLANSNDNASPARPCSTLHLNLSSPDRLFLRTAPDILMLRTGCLND